jgi:hypothetical protein
MALSLSIFPILLTRNKMIKNQRSLQKSWCAPFEEIFLLEKGAKNLANDTISDREIDHSSTT